MTRNQAKANRDGKEKHAVVVIHGMGEQHPMSTLRSFVRTVWQRNQDIVSPYAATDDDREVWIKPDRTARSFELQRITTREASGRQGEKIRLDFYEFYWAHQTAGTTLAQLRDWFNTLLWRSPSTVPRDVFHIWCLLWLSVIIAAVISLAQFFGGPMAAEQGWLRWAIPLLSLLALGLLTRFLLPYFGDVARYVRPAPDNIKIRHDIREAGVDFLEKLNDAKSSEDTDRYDRITIVGHSLGSIIAYDLLIHFWAKRAQEIFIERDPNGTKALETIEEMERLAQDLAKKDEDIDLLKAKITPTWKLQERLSTWLANLQDMRLVGLGQPQIEKQLDDEEEKRDELVRQFQHLQRVLFDELGNLQPAWNIADFISIGSPLTHAEFLMARDEETFRRRVRERSLSACPPVLETVRYREGGTKKTKQGFSYQPNKKTSEAWLMNHAAVFAPVRWTNIYDDDKLIVYGDIISGSVVPLFGPAIDDIRVTVYKESLSSRFFTHASYWTWDHGEDDAPPVHIRTLQRAVFQDVFPDRAKPGG